MPTPPPSKKGSPSKYRASIKGLSPAGYCLYTTLKQIKSGTYSNESSWRKFKLKKGEYEEILRLVKQDQDLFGYFDDKIRYDYEPGKCCFYLRMPNPEHEALLSEVTDHILDQIKTLRRGSGDAAAFASSVRQWGSTTYHFPGEAGEIDKSPDCSISHDESIWPGVILEVANPQQSKKLDKLAHNYILDSDGSVNIVIGLDLVYTKEKHQPFHGTFSVWRPYYDDNDQLLVRREIFKQIFRDSHGDVGDHPGIQFRLSDFASEDIANTLSDSANPNITLSTQELCAYLTAVEKAIRIKRERGNATRLRRGGKRAR